MALEIVGTTTTVNTDAANITFTVPTVGGGIQAGDIIVAVGMHCEAEDNAWGTPSGMDGEWLAELHVGQAPASIPGVQVWYEICAGGESGTRTATGTFTGGIAGVCFVVRGADTTTPLDVAITTVQSSATGQPDPPSITPVSDDCMIVIVCFMDDTDTTNAPSSPPTNYNLIATVVQTSTPTSGRLGVAYRVLSGGGGSPENPGSWTLDGNDEWAAATIAIRPLVSANLNSNRLLLGVG